MSVTNCSPTLWQCFFSSRAFYDLLFSSSFCSFFLFFPFQGLAHLTLNDQGMGSFLFIWVLGFFFFFRGIDSASCPRDLLKAAAFPPNLLLCFLPSLCSRPFISRQILPYLPNPFQHSPPSLPPSLLLHSLIHLFIYFGSDSFPPLLPLPAAISLCFSVSSTNLCPTPCPVLWLTSWTFTSDHLWPRRPDPGAEGNIFLLSLLLGLKTQKRKKNVAYSAEIVFPGVKKMQKKKSIMCPDPIHLTLQGESVDECAEFLITTLLTFLLFGTQIFWRATL